MSSEIGLPVLSIEVTDSGDSTTSSEDVYSAIDDSRDIVDVVASAVASESGVSDVVSGVPVDAGFQAALVELNDARYVKSVVEAPTAEDPLSNESEINSELSADQGSEAFESVPIRYFPRGPLTKPTDSQARKKKDQQPKRKDTKTPSPQPPPNPPQPSKAETSTK